MAGCYTKDIFQLVLKKTGISNILPVRVVDFDKIFTRNRLNPNPQVINIDPFFLDFENQYGDIIYDFVHVVFMVGESKRVALIDNEYELILFNYYLGDDESIDENKLNQTISIYENIIRFYTEYTINILSFSESGVKNSILREIFNILSLIKNKPGYLIEDEGNASFIDALKCVVEQYYSQILVGEGREINDLSTTSILSHSNRFRSVLNRLFFYKQESDSELFSRGFALGGKLGQIMSEFGYRYVEQEGVFVKDLNYVITKYIYNCELFELTPEAPNPYIIKSLIFKPHQESPFYLDGFHPNVCGSGAICIGDENLNMWLNGFLRDHDESVLPAVIGAVEETIKIINFDSSYFSLERGLKQYSKCLGSYDNFSRITNVSNKTISCNIRRF